jgi:predicted GTPase
MSNAQEESVEKRLKIVLLGDSGAGKVSSFDITFARSRAL